MRILEEFWYGNIEPAEYDSSPCKEYKELLQLITRNEEKLLSTMTDFLQVLHGYRLRGAEIHRWQHDRH